MGLPQSIARSCRPVDPYIFDPAERCLAADEPPEVPLKSPKIVIP